MPAPPPLILERLDSSSESDLNTLVVLYEQSFPPSERKPIPTLRRMLTHPSYHFLFATQNYLPVGFAIVRILTDTTAALLEYMAVTSTHRGQGIGGQLFLATAQAIQSPPRTLLIETESDRDEIPGNTNTRTRRKLFYRSLGARELHNLAWIMPPVISIAPPPMELLALNSATSVNKEQLRQWLTSIYVEVYEQAPYDPRIDTMLANLPNSVSIR